MNLSSTTDTHQVSNLVNLRLPTSMNAGSLEQRNTESPAGITKVAEEFESVFLSLLMKEMRNTLDESSGGLFGSENSDTYGGMFDMMMGQAMAKGRHLGIADIVETYLSRDRAVETNSDNSAQQARPPNESPTGVPVTDRPA